MSDPTPETTPGTTPKAPGAPSIGLPEPVAGGWRAVLTIVGLVVLARIVYLLVLSPYTLAEDEAHYWEWSRRLDWSYYSKGPGVSWVIWLATSAFGDHEWAVRLPAVLAHGVAALSACGLAREVFGSARAGLYAAGMVLLVPAFQALSVLMTIDGPYLACWMLCSWLAVRATLRPGKGIGLVGLWALAGLVFAAGFWFKYTILALAPGLVAMAWALRGMAPMARTLKGVAVLLVVGLLVGVAPVAIWNAQHDWVTVRHLLGHLGLAGGDLDGTLDAGSPWTPWFWMPEYLLMLAALAGPLLFLAVTEAVDLRRERDERPRAASAGLGVAALALPVLAMYLVVTLFTRVEGNWALAGVIGLAPLIGHAGARAADRVAAMRAAAHPVRFTTRPLPSHLWRAGVILGVITGVVMLRLDVFESFPRVRDLVPTHRVAGMHEHSAEVDSLVDDLRERTGLEPFVMSEHYGRASQLAFYLEGQPTVYAAQGNTGGRRTQYDLWPETDLMARETQLDLTGRPGILIGGAADRWAPAFDRIEALGELASEPKAGTLAFIGRGYRGFPAEGYDDPRVGEPLLGDPVIPRGTGAHGDPHGGSHGGSPSDPHARPSDQGDRDDG